MHSELFNILHHDHEILLNIIDNLENSFADRRWLFDQLNTGIIAHTKGEEYAFYPRLQTSPELDNQVDELLVQHREMLGIMESMKNNSLTSREWLPLLGELKNHLHRHIQTEENLIFFTAQNRLTNQELEQITTDFINKKQQIMNELTRPQVR